MGLVKQNISEMQNQLGERIKESITKNIDGLIDNSKNSEESKIIKLRILKTQIEQLNSFKTKLNEAQAEAEAEAQALKQAEAESKALKQTDAQSEKLTEALKQSDAQSKKLTEALTQAENLTEALTKAKSDADADALTNAKTEAEEQQTPELTTTPEQNPKVDLKKIKIIPNINTIFEYLKEYLKEHKTSNIVKKLLENNEIKKVEDLKEEEFNKFKNLTKTTTTKTETKQESPTPKIFETIILCLFDDVIKKINIIIDRKVKESFNFGKPIITDKINTIIKNILSDSNKKSGGGGDETQNNTSANASENTSANASANTSAQTKNNTLANASVDASTQKESTNIFNSFKTYIPTQNLTSEQLNKKQYEIIEKITKILQSCIKSNIGNIVDKSSIDTEIIKQLNNPNTTKGGSKKYISKYNQQSGGNFNKITNIIKCLIKQIVDQFGNIIDNKVCDLFKDPEIRISILKQIAGLGIQDKPISIFGFGGSKKQKKIKTRKNIKQYKLHKYYTKRNKRKTR